ncbi:MAG: hypothetical protein AAGF33_18575, partial [Pseudomonadota bacterium]
MNMLQVRNRAPDRLEHAVLSESNPTRPPKSAVAPGEGATFLFALSIFLGALLYLQLPIEPSTVMIAVGFGVVSTTAIAAQRVG